MKVIATNIFDFTTWYKFGIKTVSKSVIIDLEDINLSGEELLQKTGFFEEEYEVFYIEVKEDIFFDDKELIDVSLYDASYIIPISETGSRLLQNKIPDFKLFAPLEDEIYRKLMSARNNALAKQGAKRVFAIFNVEWNADYEGLIISFLNSLEKYKANLNAQQITVLDEVLFYERSKPYPLTDQGFLFDLGSIIRSRFNIQDDDIISKDILKETDPDKFEVIEQIISLSKFLANKELVGGVWSEFIKYYEKTPQLNFLNEKLSLSNELRLLNNLLSIGLYLKFRDMIRNTRTLEDNSFTEYIKKSLDKVPDEAKIALLFNGLFFGGLKFKELHYKVVPLAIAINKSVKLDVQLMDYDAARISSQINQMYVSNKNSEELMEAIADQRIKETLISELKPEVFIQEFNNVLWKHLEPFLIKYNSKQREKVKKIFNDIKGLDKSKMFTSELDIFIISLKKEAKSKKAKAENRLTEEIVTEIITEINNFNLGNSI